MLERVSDLRKTNHSKEICIRYLQKNGRMTIYMDDLGYICYETKEYEEYKKNVRIGRPYKISNGEKVVRVKGVRGRPRKDRQSENNTNNDTQGGKNE